MSLFQVIKKKHNEKVKLQKQIDNRFAISRICSRINDLNEQIQYCECSITFNNKYKITSLNPEFTEHIQFCKKELEKQNKYLKDLL